MDLILCQNEIIIYDMSSKFIQIFKNSKIIQISRKNARFSYVFLQIKANLTSAKLRYILVFWPKPKPKPKLKKWPKLAEAETEAETSVDS